MPSPFFPVAKQHGKRNRFAKFFGLCFGLLALWMPGIAGRTLAADEEVPGKQYLKRPSRAKKEALPSPALPWPLVRGERIAFLGGSLAERQNLFGNLEAGLHAAAPDMQLVVRNFGRPAEEVAVQQRSANYSRLDDPLDAFGADTFFCFFGFNESFAGAAGVDAFQSAYVAMIERYKKTYPRDDEGSPPRFLLFTPIAFEETGDPLQADGRAANERLAQYAQAVREVGKQLSIPVVELFQPTLEAFGAQPGCQYTIQGFQLDEAGDALLASVALPQILGRDRAEGVGKDPARLARIRSVVNDKSWIHLQDYRMLNGWYVYGGRRTWDHETFPREYLKIRRMAEVRDQYLWDLAAGKPVPAEPDDSQTGDLVVPETRFGNPQQDYSEPEELRYLSPEESIAAMEVPGDLQVQLFADERRFPELAKPVQLNFDDRGRLWVACMPTYPQWRPGDARPDDRLLIFEDEDGDGQADRCKVFYDKLHCPTGFEFYRGGVLVVDQPRLIWLKDTDGDDVADQVVHLLDGWGTDDTHHTIGAFENSHGGLLTMLEGVAMSTTVETPWGPKRWQGAAGAFELDPVTLDLRRFTTPGYGNPWCMVYDPWGQGIVGDGTTAQQHWATALSGAQIGPRRGLDPIFDNQGMRPVIGNEFLISRHLPDAYQGDFTYACVINMNGFPRFRFGDDGAGLAGQRLMRADGKPDDLIRSSDKNFRPSDPQIGPDGALWFGDWCNALIGHMQYSQRDPNRDHQRGRIYRLVAKDRPLVAPATQAGKSELELLEQLREPEPRTRYRVRNALAARPVGQVREAVERWLPTIRSEDPQADRLRTEALWILQRHHVVDSGLLGEVLRASSKEARSAAVRVVSDLQRLIPEKELLEILRTASGDSDPRVRAEAARALSFFPNEESVRMLLEIASKPMDKWLGYVVEHAIGATESAWSPLLEQGKLADAPVEGMKAVDRYLASARPGLAAQRHLVTLLNPESGEVAKVRAYSALSGLSGNKDNGKAVFGRVCASCHKVADKGYAFGPELTDVGRRLTRYDLIESIVDPNAKMDKKYLTEIILTADGKVHTGFIGEETDTTILLLLPEGKRETIAKEEIEERKVAMQSSMPENLGATIAPSEFLDVIEYLGSLK